MVKKGIHKKSKKNHLESAKKYYRDADILIHEQMKSDIYNETPIKYLEMSGKEYMRARKFLDAEIMFGEAVRYAQYWRERKPEVISAEYRDRLQRNHMRMYKIGESQLGTKLLHFWDKVQGKFLIFPLVVIIVSLVAGVVFLQSGITGNSIANLDTSITSSVGVALLAVALITGFFYLKKEKK
ncbi:MAG: hypothetical protein ABIF18_02490 [archaeon]